MQKTIWFKLVIVGATVAMSGCSGDASDKEIEELQKALKGEDLSGPINLGAGPNPAHGKSQKERSTE